eukprot:3207632-Rhodomonas_salina.1
MLVPNSTGSYESRKRRTGRVQPVDGLWQQHGQTFDGLGLQQSSRQTSAKCVYNWTHSYYLGSRC